MRLLFGIPNESNSWGLTLKSRGTKEHRRGMKAPGNSATTEKAPRGRQRTEQVVIEHVRYSVAPSGLSIVDAFVPGVFTPVCDLSHLRCLFSKQQYTYTFSTFSILLLFLFTFLFFYFFTFSFYHFNFLLFHLFFCRVSSGEARSGGLFFALRHLVPPKTRNGLKSNCV